MKASAYFYDETEDGYQLCLGEYSTIEGLQLLDAESQITITGLEGSQGGDWLSKEQAPKLQNVAEVIDFLRASSELDLIDFEASIAGVGSLYTHDDGECHFLFSRQEECLRVLRLATEGDFSESIISSLLSHPGYYITCSEAGVLRKYSTFDDYLAENPS
jgi:hypothetical protein